MKIPAIVIELKYVNYITPSNNFGCIDMKTMNIFTIETNNNVCKNNEHEKDLLSSCRQCNFNNEKNIFAEFIMEHEYDNGYIIIYYPEDEDIYDINEEPKDIDIYTRNGGYFFRNQINTKITRNFDKTFLKNLETKLGREITEIPEWIVRHGNVNTRPKLLHIENIWNKQINQDIQIYLEKIESFGFKIDIKNKKINSDRVRNPITTNYLRNWNYHLGQTRLHSQC